MQFANNPVAAEAEQLPAGTDWREYVPGPLGPDVLPTNAIDVTGDVTGVEDFLAHVGPLTLTFPDGGIAPAIVLDYGREVAGIPWLTLASSSGQPTVRLSYSESAAWTGPDGDDHGSHNDSANRTRVELFTAAEGRLTTGLIQGGQRYQRIALDTPGSVTITDAGMRFVAYPATPENYAGWFVSSSDLLNRIWYDGAYTVQINQLPADTIPIAWRVEDGALRTEGGTIAVLKAGADWTDVTVTFEAELLERAIGWTIRAEHDGARGYLCTLRAGESPDDSGTFELTYFDDGYNDRPQDTVRRYTLLATERLQEPLTPGDWHRIRTSITGPLITVTLDDRLIGIFDTATLSDSYSAVTSGSVGFHHMWGTSRVMVEHARFRHLRVADADGALVYDNPLDDPSVLEDFVGDGVTSPDPLPVILDGGKRDRTVWSGDLLVQIPNVFYTTAAEEYVRGSIELLNGYQEPTGQSAARVPPLMPLKVAPQHGQTYSAVYSMHQVINVGLHHLHTGDADFARAQWPAIQRQLAYDRSLTDDRGLLITDDSNGLDWDWYDGAKTGAVSAYNITQYQTLLHAATLAAAIGQEEDAGKLRSQAVALRAAINRHLYDAERHLYVLSDHQRDAVAQDANALAVLAGVVPDGDAVALLRALAAALPNTAFGYSPFSDASGFRTDISPYVTGSHLTALFAAGLTDDALRLVHDLWGHMSTAELHSVGTAWELVATDGSPGFGATTSLAHGWASGASVALSSYVLGVRPITPGFRQWTIAPQPGALAWARGQVPTPAGPLIASWTCAGDRFQLDVEIPDGTAGTIVIPLNANTATARLDAQDHVDADTPREPASVRAGTATFHIGRGGRYRITAD